MGINYVINNGQYAIYNGMRVYMTDVSQGTPGVLPPSFLSSDGSTAAWYIADVSSSIIFSGNDVSTWKDYLNSGRNLLQPDADRRPLWTSNGVLFDGAIGILGDYMQAQFTYNQPESIYVVMKQVTWVSDMYMWDGYTDYMGLCWQHGSTPQLDTFPGIDNPNGNLAVDTFGIVRNFWNSASSKLQINNTAAVTRDGGTDNYGGFTIGGSTAGLYCSNIQVKEIILRRGADSPADETAIYDYLALKYSIS
jgi:hypothetical protein